MNKTQLQQLGFPYSNNLLLLFEGGSKMHGAKLEGHDDTDYYGIFVEPPEKLLGLDVYEHFVHTTGGERGGNGPEDVDICLYGLRRWAELACKGNPSVLSFLFAQPLYTQLLWSRLNLRPELFLARSHLGAFLGYANAQLRRLYGQRGGKDCNRPFLEEQFGYDTKYAMHIIRLLGEAKELMLEGHLTFPRPNKEELIAIRKGHYKLYEFEGWANALEKEALEASKHSPLPERVDREAISKAITKTYRTYWKDYLGEPAQCPAV